MTTKTVTVNLDGYERRCRKCKTEVVAEPCGFYLNEKTQQFEVTDGRFPPGWSSLFYCHIYRGDAGQTRFYLPLCPACARDVLAFIGIINLEQLVGKERA